MSRSPALFGQMSVLSDPMRSRLLLVLERNELTVGELCAVVRAPQSTVSRHLKSLSDAGWVVSRADGTARRYAMSAARLDAAQRGLWLLVRKETTATADARQDEHRVTHVLAARRSRSEEFFRSEAGRWDQMRDELFGRRFFLPALLGLLPEDTLVADLGCGTGQVAAALAPFAGRVIGVDASPSMLRTARKRLAGQANVELRAGALEKLPIEDGSLDAATMFLVLHHLPDPARAIAEVARALKPGGRFVLVDMAPHDREEYRSRMGHLWLGFAPAEIERLFGGTAFESTRIVPLPSDPGKRGPDLFVARAVRRATASRKTHPRLVTS
jgi:ubiquinone/menaquinone biosynthesis C-methylase UbiE